MPPAKACRRRRRRGPRRSPRSPAQLVEDTVGEILLRLPPNDPASLVRASAVSKTWRRALADPTFPARYRAFHRTPPVLGVFWGDAVLVPTTSFRPPAADHSDCNVLDCRHGRVLLENLDSGGLFVWDPITGDLRRLPEVPDIFSLVCNGAVLCAAGARCDHLACHGGAFLVALVGASIEGEMHACLYSSETGAWSAPTSALLDYIYIPPDYTATTSCITVDNVPAALVGDALYFIGDFGNEILRYDLVGENQNLAVVDPPDVETCYDGVVVMPEENGRLGFAFVKANSLHLWLMETGPDGYGRWEKRRVINLETLFPVFNLSPYLSGFVDAINCIVVTTDDAVFTIELKSLQTRKVCKTEKPYCSGLYASFYIPACAGGIPPEPLANGD
ncbi:hypothetical protein GQ55_8G122900 [Panicum hallii var. hallii]|uniref:Uncharacterized protein n=1 Tax=Panicum hallii var. hallii TaxID=1504633 RepID=A0A2T7CMT9_9POAL|nr:hypothetical protein GQ55_8G122900 [Panicum hallii var. hallii]